MKNMIITQIRRLTRRFGFDVVRYYTANADSRYPLDFDQTIIDTLNTVQAFTQTSPERIAALCEAVRYIVTNDIPGSIVECGVWKGGSMMAVTQTLLRLNDTNRELYLFDTFEGMPPPSEKDVAITGEKASMLLEQSQKDDETSLWCYAPLASVKQAVYSIGYPREKIHFIQGRIENTLPDRAPSTVAILRLDTDWYESTRYELLHLFPRISFGGVLIIDDYGHWQGARQAVDEYIRDNKIKIMLNRIDYTGRIGIVLKDC